MASQPTIARFENPSSRTELARMALVVLEQCSASSVSPPSVIVLAGDDPEAPGHGEQAQARYDGSYGGSCFRPLHLYEGLSGRLSPTILKAQRCTGTPMLAVVKRLGTHRRHAWPDTLVLLRGDSPCASPAVRPWTAEPPALHYGTGVTSKAVLQKLARAVVEQAKRAYGSSGRKVPRFHSTRYHAQTWARSRRVVITVAGSAQGVNPRCVVTDMAQARPHGLYQPLYCARGQAENESKEHKLSLQSARTAGHRFEATQCRLLRPSAAYVLRETVRREV